MGKLIFPKISLENVNGVLLDIDNTIYHYQTCHSYSLNILIKQISRDFFIPIDKVESIFFKSRKIINEKLYGLASSHSRLLYIQLTIESIISKTDFSKTLELEKLYWKSFFYKMTINKDAKQFLVECEVNKIPICCVTDLTSQIQFKKILNLKIENMIKYIVTSEESGAEKPHKIIFDLALEKLNLNYDDVIMVGDNLSKDIKGAQELGIKSYLVKER